MISAHGISNSGIRDSGLRFRVPGLGFRVRASSFKSGVQGLELRVWDAIMRVLSTVASRSMMEIGRRTSPTKRP